MESKARSFRGSFKEASRLLADIPPNLYLPPGRARTGDEFNHVTIVKD